LENNAEAFTLEHLLGNLLQADPDWLTKHSPTSYSYWQNKLETKLSAEANDDGSMKLRAATIIATNIQDAKAGERVCAALNYLACSWAFAYDYEEHTIKALSSLNLYIHNTNEPPTKGLVEPQPFQDAWFTIFTNIIWAQNAMAAELAQEIANAANGIPAYSKPENQTALRAEPDVFNHIPDVLRQRPEWLLDARPYTQWPAFETIADQTVLMANEELVRPYEWIVEETTTNNALLSNKSETGYVGSLGIRRFQDFRYGESFSSVHFIARPNKFSDIELLNKANLFMYESAETTQFGTWRFTEETFTFNQSIPAAFIRCIESSAGAVVLSNYNPVFFSRLNRFALNIDDCLRSIQNSEPVDQTTDNADEILDLVIGFMKTLEAPANKPLANASDGYECATPDPLILRGESLYNFFTICVFNPIGPTIHSLEGYGTDGDDLIVVDTMRHPLYPAYLPLGHFDPSSPEMVNMLESSIDRMFNHIPDYIFMDGCPEQIRPPLDELIKAKLLKLAHEQNADVAAKLTRLKELNQSPWQRVDHDLEPIPQAPSPATRGQVEDLFDHITSPENTVLFWNHIPDAWDGSLNNASINGFISDTHVGPLVWAYNLEIGNA
jgi:hypothetical protein